jgi:hypothetical protein
MPFSVYGGRLAVYRREFTVESIPLAVYLNLTRRIF